MEQETPKETVRRTITEQLSKDGVVEIIIREGTAPKQLDVLPPRAICLNGVLSGPAEFLCRRIYADLINQYDCHVIANRESISIQLVINEADPYTKGTVTGVLEFHPKFVEFGINSTKSWEPIQLGKFFKMNRAFFPDKGANMALVTSLTNFVANINSLIEKQKNGNGDFKDNFSGVVTSNLPGTFKLSIPIFKGQPKEDLEVEFWASVSGRDVTLQLLSPGACQSTEELRDKVLNEQLDIIRAIAPQIVIIEQ